MRWLKSIGSFLGFGGGTSATQVTATVQPGAVQTAAAVQPGAVQGVVESGAVRGIEPGGVRADARVLATGIETGGVAVNTNYSYKAESLLAN